MMARSPVSVTAALALVAVLVSGCITVLPPGSGGQPTGATPSGFDDIGNPGALTPPILEEGDVPAYEETSPALGHLTLGPPTDLVSQTIGAAGGILEASGLSISIPDGALSGDTAFNVQLALITGADFGGLVTPITPLYLVDDGEAALGALVTLTMSATVPAGALAMAFSYDDAAGTITPLIPISQDGSSLTVGATHFSGTFGALVDSTILPITADSGFRPGKDDWQFTNFGSYVAPGGHCNGQSSTAIWYYVNQYRKAGAHPLYGVYDNNAQGTKTPDLWEDDSYAYRFASTVQADPAANPFTVQYFSNFLHEPNDRATYEAFRAAISTTAEPQLVWIGNDARHVAHAMVVYRVEKDQLFVADPNYPARLRTIPYDPATGQFGPYSSGENAAEIVANGATVYTRFTYLPWRSTTSDEAIAAHWAEFKAGTAGSTVFPAYELRAQRVAADGAASWEPLVDGYRTTGKQLKIQSRDPAANYVRMWLYPGTSSTALGNGDSVTVELHDGVNDLGIQIGFLAGDLTYKYVDFVRLTVTLEPAPSPTGGQWVLTSTEQGGPFPSSYEKPGEKLTVESSSGQIAYSYNYDGPPRRHEEASVSWGPPPATAAPGDTWTSTLSAAGTCSGDIDYTWGAGVNVYVFWTEAGEMTNNHWSATVDCQHDSASTELSWVFPIHDGPTADKLEIDVSSDEEHSGDSWTYYYEWRP